MAIFTPKCKARLYLAGSPLLAFAKAIGGFRRLVLRTLWRKGFGAKAFSKYFILPYLPGLMFDAGGFNKIGHEAHSIKPCSLRLSGGRQQGRNPLMSKTFRIALAML